MNLLISQAVRNLTFQAFLDASIAVDTAAFDDFGTPVLKSSERDVHFFVTHFSVIPASAGVNCDLALFVCPTTGGGQLVQPVTGAWEDINGSLFAWAGVAAPGPWTAQLNPCIVVPAGYHVRLYRTVINSNGLYRINFRGFSMKGTI